MAEESVPEKTLSCESAAEVNDMVEKHLKFYTGFLTDHAKIHEGIVSHCCHRDEAVKKVSQLIDKLEELKVLMKSHVHVIDEAHVIRGNPGRRNMALQRKPTAVPRDSGVDSTTSQDLRASNMAISDLNISGTWRADNTCSATGKNVRTQTCDDNNKQRYQGYNDVGEDSQTHTKTLYNSNSGNSRGKDDSGVKEKDNRKSYDC